MVLFLAFSLQAEVEKYGAYVGIAAFFGLAVLALLYFSQARELKRLREWAGRAPERAQEIEARAIAQAEETRRLQAQPVAVAAATAGAHAASAGAAPATQVLEENGQAGNGTAAAAEEHENGAVTTAPQDLVEVTEAGEAAQLIEPDIPVAGGDDGEPAEAQADGAAEAVDGAVAASERAEADGGVAAVEAPAADGGVAAGEAPEADGAVAAAETPDADGAVAADETPAAAGVVGAAEAPAPGPQPELAPVAAAGDAEVIEVGEAGQADIPQPDEEEPESGEMPVLPRATPLPRRAPAPAQPAAALRQPGRSATLPPPPAAGRPSQTGAGDSHSLRNGLLAGAGLLIILVGVLFATGVIGGSGKSSTPPDRTSGTSTSTASPSGGQAEPSLTPKSTKVAVLNGTTIGGLASTEADKLRTAGYTGKVTTGNNTDQQRADSSVMYGAHAGARTQARTVAHRLNIATVQSMDADTRDLSENADVVVILGQDKAP